MEKIAPELERWAVHRQREWLEQDREYQRRQGERARAWERFVERYPKETVHECLDLIDRQGILAEQEGRFLFWFGVRLGLALRSGELPEAE